jgi:hypothetical protein
MLLERWWALYERISGAKETDSAEGLQHGTAVDEARVQGGNTQTGSFNMRKRISSTTYEVTVHFSGTNGETLDEKILRLARSEALNEGTVRSEESVKE